MHYFSPVHKMPLLEVIRTDKTDPASGRYGGGGRQEARQDGDRGQRRRRLLHDPDARAVHERGLLAAHRGLARRNDRRGARRLGLAGRTDDAARRGWHRRGAHVGRIMLEAFGDRVDPAPVIAKLVPTSARAARTSAGFYLYGEAAKKAGKGKHVDPSIYDAIGQSKPNGRAKVSKEDIQLRCSLQFVNEALLCFGEKILRSARDGDVGAVFGLGFPPFRGGPFRLVDEMGATDVLRRMRATKSNSASAGPPAPVSSRWPAPTAGSSEVERTATAPRPPRILVWKSRSAS